LIFFRPGIINGFGISFEVPRFRSMGIATALLKVAFF
jgi:hypothetical protein